MKQRFSPFFIAIIVSNFIFFGAIGFLWMAIRGTIKESVENIVELEKARFREQNVKILREAITATELQRKTLESYFITKDEAVNVLEKVEEVGHASGASLDLSVINWREESQTDVMALEISAHLKGSFQSIYQALSLIERLPYKIDMVKIAVLENNSGKDARFWESQITFAITSVK